MGPRRTFLLIAAAAIAAPATASAQETEHVFVTGAAQEHVFVTGAAQDTEHVFVTGAAQDREPLVSVVGAITDRRTAAPSNAADRTLRSLPVVYEDEPAPAPARTASPAARPNR
jgi:hypothetical protein